MAFWSRKTAEPVQTHTESNITNLTTDLAAKAPLVSPAFTGVPTAPTASSGTNTTQLATTAFVVSSFARVGSGNIYDGEQKFQNSSYCPTAMDNASGVGCAYKASRGAVNQEIVGQIIAPCTAASDSNYSISNTANVIKFQRISSASAAAPTLADMGKVTSKGWEGGAVLTGIPTAPNATAGTSTMQIATTSFVANAVSQVGGTTIIVSATQPTSQKDGDLWYQII